MIRKLAALALLAAVAFAAVPAFGSPWPVVTSLEVILSPVGGIGGMTDAGQLVDLTVTDAGGTIKAVGRTVADPSGGFSLSPGFGPYGSAVPGDTLSFVLADNPAATFSLVYPHIALTGFNLATGTISGRVTPRQDRVVMEIGGSRVIPDAGLVAKRTNVGWTNDPVGAPIARDGRFSLRPAMSSAGWSGTIRRNDNYIVMMYGQLVVGNPDFTFRVYQMGMVPGLAPALIGTGLSGFYGPFFRNYTARLVSPAGRLKGTAATTLGLMGPSGILDFRKSDGRPGIIQSGDTIKVAGVGGFTQRVPRLKGIIDLVANNAMILAPPDSFVQVGFTLYDLAGAPSAGPATAWVKTDATGAAVASVGAYELHEGDEVSLSFTDARGNFWVTENQALP